MPLYEYKCDACGSVFEVLQKFSDEPVAVHEVCGGRVERLLSASAFQFKGSGWYVTDYARKGGNGSAGAKAAEPGEKAESKTETKPEVKSGAKAETKQSASTSEK